MFQRIQTQNDELNRIQDNITKAFNDQSSPFVGGRLLTSVAVNSSGTAINHGLTRTPTIWVLCDLDTATAVYKTAWDANTITLKAGSNCTVSLWVN